MQTSQPVPEGSKKQMPAKVRQFGPAFSVVFHEESEAHKDAKSAVMKEIMSFMEPFSTRTNMGIYLRNSLARAEKEYLIAQENLKKVGSGCQSDQ